MDAALFALFGAEIEDDVGYQRISEDNGGDGGDAGLAGLARLAPYALSCAPLHKKAQANSGACKKFVPLQLRIIANHILRKKIGSLLLLPIALSLSAALLPTRPQQNAPDRCVDAGEQQRSSAFCAAQRPYTAASRPALAMRKADLSALWLESLKQPNDSVPDSLAVLPAIGDSTAVDSASLAPSLLRAIRAFDQGLDIDSAMRDTLPLDRVKER